MCMVTVGFLAGLPVAMMIVFFRAIISTSLGVGLLCATIASIVVNMTFLALTSWRNPGIWPRTLQNPEGNMTWHEDCRSYRPRGVVFCTETRVLARDIDHFCPWTGTLIAGGNIGTFNCFLMSMGAVCFSTLAMVMVALGQAMNP